MRHKRKCSRNFPCTECRGSGEECVPSKRRYRQSKKANPDAHSLEVPKERQAQQEDVVPTNETPVRKNGGAQNLRNYNDPNRKYMFNHPPVIGSYAHWSNKRMKYDPVPDGIDAIREKFFLMENPILLNSQQYAYIWPHISNMYSRSNSVTLEPNGTQLEVWECRNQRRQAKHRREHPTQGLGKRKREKKNDLLESEEPCKIRFRIVSYVKHANTTDENHKFGLATCNCVPEWVFMERTATVKDSMVAHNHSLEALDKFKRSDAVLFFCRLKVEEGGYMYASVRRWLKTHYGDKTKQLEHLSDNDISNAARPWRAANRDLNLIENIEEPSPEEQARQRCLDLLGTARADGLRRALADICHKIPQAVGIALPPLHAAQEKQPDGGDGDGTEGEIQEGEDVVIPAPGLPEKVRPVLKPSPLPPQPKLPSPHKLAGQLPPDVFAQPTTRLVGSYSVPGQLDAFNRPSSEMLGPHPLAGQLPPDVYDQQNAAATGHSQQAPFVVHNAPPQSQLQHATQYSQLGPRENSFARTPPLTGNRQQSASNPSKPFTYQPPPKETSTPSSEVSRPPRKGGERMKFTPPYGGNSTYRSGYGYDTPAPASTANASVPSAVVSTPMPYSAASSVPVLGSTPEWIEQRPSWAMPVAEQVKPVVENEKDRVTRQLDAELRIQNTNLFLERARADAKRMSAAMTPAGTPNRPVGAAPSSVVVSTPSKPSSDPNKVPSAPQSGSKGHRGTASGEQRWIAEENRAAEGQREAEEYLAARKEAEDASRAERIASREHRKGGDEYLAVEREVEKNSSPVAGRSSLGTGKENEGAAVGGNEAPGGDGKEASGSEENAAGAERAVPDVEETDEAASRSPSMHANRTQDAGEGAGDASSD